MPNCPFRDEKDIKKMFNNFKKLKCKFMISHVKFYFANPWWAIIKKKIKFLEYSKTLTKKDHKIYPRCYLLQELFGLRIIILLLSREPFTGKIINKIYWTGKKE